MADNIYTFTRTSFNVYFFNNNLITTQYNTYVNANPKDTKIHPKGVWTLPPTLRLGEEDRQKYLAIGESDRMTLKFIKPKQF